MKSLLKISTFILLIGVVAFPSCKKQKPTSSDVLSPSPSPAKAKTIKARIVQYGTNQPVAGATLSVCSSPLPYTTTNQDPCAGNYQAFTSDAGGEVFFEADQYRYSGIIKDGYWAINYEPCFNKYFGDADSSSFNWSQGIHTADSFLVKIVPQTYITIHIRNCNSSPRHSVNLIREGVFKAEGCSFYPGGGIILRPNIDTTFQYPVFGNTENLFTVSDHYDVSDYGNIYYQEFKFIPHGNNFILNIMY